MSTRTAETIYTTLVDDIIAGRMAPGAPLVETTLAEQFGVSRTPVREALQRLEQANLAERGARSERPTIAAADRDPPAGGSPGSVGSTGSS